MGRFAIGFVSLGLLGPVAQADPKPEPPVHFEVGFNTRHFTAVENEQVAFRGESPDPSADAHTAMSLDLRFTAWLPLHMYTGLEGEVGRLDTYDGSNLAGVYGLLGTRFHLSSLSLFAELAAGQRKVRYSLADEDERKLIAEPRVRAEMWLNPRVTIGAALGSTLGGRDVWMAGIYLGVHSLVYGNAQP